MGHKLLFAAFTLSFLLTGPASAQSPEPVPEPPPPADTATPFDAPPPETVSPEGPPAEAPPAEQPPPGPAATPYDVTPQPVPLTPYETAPYDAGAPAEQPPLGPYPGSPMGPNPFGPPTYQQPPGAPPFGAPPTFGQPIWPGEQPRKKKDVRLGIGIGSAAVGAVSLVVMGVSIAQLGSLQGDSGFDTYRAGITHDQSACDVAATGYVVPFDGASSPSEVTSLCNQAKAWEATTYATAAIGGVGLAAGLVLILTSDTVWSRIAGDDNRHGLVLLPTFGPDGGGALFGARF